MKNQTYPVVIQQHLTFTSTTLKYNFYLVRSSQNYEGQL